MKKVVLVGLKLDVVDFKKWPELSKEKLEAAFEQVFNELTENGYEAEWCLTDTGETAEAQVKETLARLNKVNANIAGLVLTQASPEKMSYYGDHYYRNTYYGEER